MKSLYFRSRREATILMMFLLESGVMSLDKGYCERCKVHELIAGWPLQALAMS